MNERQQQLKEEVKHLLEQAEAADEEEDRQYGSRRATSCRKNRGGARLGWPRSGKPRKSLSNEHGTKQRRKAIAPKVQPGDKDQYNFTDPESRIMKGADGIVQGYNAQAAVSWFCC